MKEHHAIAQARACKIQTLDGALRKRRFTVAHLHHRAIRRTAADLECQYRSLFQHDSAATRASRQERCVGILWRIGIGTMAVTKKLSGAVGHAQQFAQ